MTAAVVILAFAVLLLALSIPPPLWKQSIPWAWFFQICKFTAVALIVPVFFLVSYGCAEPVPSSPAARQTSACNMSRSFVKDKLKAPSTASWQDCKVFSDPDRPDRYTVQSSVDSQNSFGANIRTKYMAILDRDPADGGWILVNLVHTP